MHEGTACALAYGIFRNAKGQFDAEKPMNILLLDLGQSAYQVTAVSFVTGSSLSSLFLPCGTWADSVNAAGHVLVASHDLRFPSPTRKTDGAGCDLRPQPRRAGL